MGVYGFLAVYGCLCVSGCLWFLWGVMSFYECLWVLMGVMGVYGYYTWKFEILLIFLFKNPRKRLKSHVCYKKLAYASRGKETSSTRVLGCFQYWHSSINPLFFPLVHNILFIFERSICFIFYFQNCVSEAAYLPRSASSSPSRTWNVSNA